MSNTQPGATVPYPTGNLGPDPVDTRDKPLFSQDDLDDLPPKTRAFEQKFLKDLPPVYDQQPFNSCTVNAVLAALRYAHRKFTKMEYKAWDPSRMFLYRNARARIDPKNYALDGNKAKDVLKTDYGTFSRVCMVSLLMEGVCSEKLWPYSGTFDDLVTKPNPVEPVDLNAAQYEAKGSSHPRDPASFTGKPDFLPRAISYYRIYAPTDAETVTNAIWQYNTHPPIAMLEQCLRLDFPFIFSMWFDVNVNIQFNIQADGSLPEAPSPFKPGGDGHSMLAVGFDSAKQRFLVQNSWGTQWNGSMKGFLWIPYSWFTANFERTNTSGVTTVWPVAYDFWVIKYSA